MTHPIKPALGKRIKKLRTSRGLTLRALAESCGLSANAISLIERGENSPTVSSLHRLASALEVPITEFFQEEHTTPGVYVERGQGIRIRNADVELESLGYGLPNQQLEPFRMTIDPDADRSCGAVSHPGQEFVYCLEGELEYFVGEEHYHLKAGDSVLLEASNPHGWHSLTQEPVTILLIFNASRESHLARKRHLELGRET